MFYTDKIEPVELPNLVPRWRIGDCFEMHILHQELCDLLLCKSGKQHKSCSSALCTMDDASYFLVIRLGPKTSECEKKVKVVSTVTGCDVTNCATRLHGFNKHASPRREAASDSRASLVALRKFHKSTLAHMC